MNEAVSLPAPSDDAAHLLVVDDDRRIRELLVQYLGDHGYRVTDAADAAQARRRLESLRFDLLVVDVMMPGESGTELTRSLRRGSNDGVPVLMLTALSEIESRIDGLEAGADDYLPKPFDPRELLLRVASILKRAGPPPEPAIENVRFGPWSFSLRKRELRKDGELRHLTNREAEILLALAEQPGKVVPRQEIPGFSPSSNDRGIDVQISRLRRKIEAVPGDPRWLRTVRGVGFQLRAS